MEKKDLEKTLSEEGKRFAPNVLGNVYEKLGIEFSNASKNKEVEVKLHEEGERFVKNNYETVSKEIPQEKKATPGFLAFIKNPITISVSATLLVGVIATSIILPIALSRSTTIDVGDEQGMPTGAANALLVDNTVTLDLTSASNTYNAKMKYVINTDGNIESDKIITLDDNSAYLIDKFDTVPSSRAGNISDENYLSFTNKYLTTALNYGYLERIDITKSNKVIFKISSAGSNDASLIKSELENQILSFIETNKVIIDFEIEETHEEIYSLFSEDEYEKASLILDLYNLSQRLFVSEKVTLSEAFFSEDIKDWAEKFKDFDIELIQDYVLMLTDFNEYIVGNNQRDLMIERFYASSQKFLNEIKTFNEYLPVITNRINESKKELLASGSNELKTILSKEDCYSDLSRYLNQKYSSQNKRLDRFEPSMEIKVWDLFINGYDMFANQMPRNPGQIQPGDFLKYLPEQYGEGTTYQVSEKGLFDLYIDLQTLVNFRDTAISFVDDNFFEIVVDIMIDQVFIADWDDNDYCHTSSEPDGWDEDFDEWWNGNDHHGPHGGH